MAHGDTAWASLAVGVIVYELTAPPGQLLSQAMDRYRTRHPIVCSVAVIYVACHLLRWWPARIDPLHHLARLGRR